MVLIVIPVPINWLLYPNTVVFHLFKDFCKELKNLPDQQIRNLRIRRNAVSGEPEIQCFMERLNEYLQVGKKKKMISPSYHDGNGFFHFTQKCSSSSELLLYYWGLVSIICCIVPLKRSRH